MPIVTGIILDGGGEAIASAKLSFTRVGSPGIDGANLQSTDTVGDTTGEDGTFSRALTGGTWRMRWYTDSGLSSELILGVPNSGGPYAVEEVAVDPQAAPTSSGVTWFSTISEMLSVPAQSWKQARTLNSVDSDSVISGWDRLLKTDPEAASMDANRDSILETDDGLAFAVRSFVAPR